MTTVGVRGKVHIACAYNDAYAPHFAALAASIAAARESETIRITSLVGADLSLATRERLSEFLSTLDIFGDFIEVPETRLKRIPPHDRYPQLIWRRLLLPDLLPDCERVLYLDSDLLALQSLVPLFQADIHSNLLAAAPSPVAGSEQRLRELGCDPAHGYFNSGVLLMNLDRMRAEDFTDRALALAAEKAVGFVYPDQDLLNLMAQNRWLKLHPRWNAISHFWLYPELTASCNTPDECLAARLSPAIVHFEGPNSIKPWHYRSVHPLRDLYRQARAQTPWPLRQLEGGSLKDVMLRRLPLGWQYWLAMNRAKIFAK